MMVIFIINIIVILIINISFLIFFKSSVNTYLLFTDFMYISFFFFSQPLMTSTFCAAVWRISCGDWRSRSAPSHSGEISSNPRSSWTTTRNSARCTRPSRSSLNPTGTPWPSSSCIYKGTVSIKVLASMASECHPNKPLKATLFARISKMPVQNSNFMNYFAK